MACSKCKKKVVKELDPVVELEAIKVQYNEKQILLAYEELTAMGGVKEDKKPFISDVYRFLFNEELDYNCGGCTTTQVRKLGNYLRYNLNINV